MFGSKRGSNFWKWIYYFSIAAFFILSFVFPVSSGLELNELSQWLGVLSHPLFIFIQVGYSLAAAFAVFYPVLRLEPEATENIKKSIQGDNLAGKFWKWAHYLSIAVFFICSFLLLREHYYMELVLFLFHFFSDILNYSSINYLIGDLTSSLVVLMFFFHLLNSLFVVFYGILRRNHSSSFWTRLYFLSVIAFFIICVALPSAILHAGIPDLFRFSDFPLLNKFGYILAAGFSIFYSALRLKKDSS